MNEVEIKVVEYIHSKNKLESNVLDFYKQIVSGYISRIGGGLDEVESPIEQLMLLALKREYEMGFHANKIISVFDVLEIIPQTTINIKTPKNEKKKYRVDFLIETMDMRNDEQFLFAVECDGFEFHSDEERFISDRERDRRLLSEGIITIRLSGKEIVENPLKCARDVFKTIYDFLIKRSKSFEKTIIGRG